MVKVTIHPVKLVLVFFLCLQMANICVYIPAWMYPGEAKAGLTQSVIALLVQSVGQDVPSACDTAGAEEGGLPTLNEEILLEDLHPPEETVVQNLLFAQLLFEHTFYHFTPDIKSHVHAVVSPPPDFLLA